MNITNLKYTQSIATEEDMLNLGAYLANAVERGVVIFLYGPLGAGKTTLTRGFLRSLGYTGKVKSPTYTLVEPYKVKNNMIFHFDFYRLSHPNELDFIGIHDYFTADSICIIEWPEKGFPLLPAADVTCHISFNQAGREVCIEAQSDRGKEILIRYKGMV